jgi:hypothetical protein
MLARSAILLFVLGGCRTQPFPGPLVGAADLGSTDLAKADLAARDLSGEDLACGSVVTPLPGVHVDQMSLGPPTGDISTSVDLAQTLTVVLPGTLVGVEVAAMQNSNTPTGTLTLVVTDEDTGTPLGSADLQTNVLPSYVTGVATLAADTTGSGYFDLTAAHISSTPCLHLLIGFTGANVLLSHDQPGYLGAIDYLGGTELVGGAASDGDLLFKTFVAD